jgi:hypothetical protein
MITQHLLGGDLFIFLCKFWIICKVTGFNVWSPVFPLTIPSTAQSHRENDKRLSFLHSSTWKNHVFHVCWAITTSGCIYMWGGPFRIFSEHSVWESGEANSSWGIVEGKNDSTVSEQIDILVYFHKKSRSLLIYIRQGHCFIAFFFFQKCAYKNKAFFFLLPVQLV